MKALSTLSAPTAQGLRGILFDLDDTFLDGGLLTEAAFASLWRLSAAGLRLVVVTGRPAGWGEVVARQWPVDAVITENGAVSHTRDGRALRRWQEADDATRRVRRARIEEVLAAMCRRFPGVRPTDDGWLRISDVAIDIGETQKVPAAIVDEMVSYARAEGVRTYRSTVHLHLTLDGFDKASGALAFLGREFGEDPTEARSHYAFLGDSGNDEACFAGFVTTFGVANVRDWVDKLSVPPQFIASRPKGAGFAEIADHVLALRKGAPPC